MYLDLENRVIKDIRRLGNLSALFLVLTCLAGFVHYILIVKKLVNLVDSWPFLVVELLLLISGILFFVHMKQWINFLKKEGRGKQSGMAEAERVCSKFTQNKEGEKDMANKEYRNEMKEVRRETVWTIGLWLPTVIIMMFVVIGLGWIVQGGDFFLFKFFAPKYEQVRRETFEQTKSYKQGTIQDLRRMQSEYIVADTEHKDALADVILHTAADFPEDQMPSDVRAFINQLRNQSNDIQPSK